MKRRSGFIPGQTSLTAALNSRGLEAIREYTGRIPKLDLDYLKTIVSSHAHDCLDLVERIEQDGVNDPWATVDLLLIDEALRYLNSRRKLYTLLFQHRAIVLLPLPPHLSDSFLRVVDPAFVFSTDRESPPHLRNYPCRMLEEMTYPELDQLGIDIEAVVLETYLDRNQIFVRDTTLNLLYLLSMKRLDTIFIHAIPHIPPRARFVELPIQAAGPDVVKI